LLYIVFNILSYEKSAKIAENKEESTMFLEELKPIVKELIQQPVAFMGGFVSAVFRVNPSEEPLKSWLEMQGIKITETDSATKPQTIAIE